MAAAAWEVWLFLSTGALQLLIGYLWRDFPDRNARNAVVGLFGFNGAAMIANAAFRVTDVASLAWSANALDALTNAFLLWAVALSLPRVVQLLLVAAASVCVAVTLPPDAATWPYPFQDALRELPLYGALSLGGVLLLRQLRDGPPRVHFLILVAVGSRFAELAVSQFIPHSIGASLDGTGFLLPFGRVTSSVVFLLGCVAFSAFALRSGEPLDRAAGVVLASGAAIGVGHVASDAALAAYFTLMLLRPVFFAQIIDIEAGHHGVFRGAAGRALARGLAGIGLGMVGATLAVAFWSASIGPALFVASGLFLLVFAIPRGAAAPAETSERPSWERRIEDSRVSLPEDWREIVRARTERYAALPAEVRARIDALSRWQRILLALEAVPQPSAGLLHREGSTASLHLATQCPYGQIGTEVARLNARAQAVANAHGVSIRPLEPLIHSSSGRVEGSRSARVKVYWLGAGGKQVAALIRRGIGIPDSIRGVDIVGESYAFDSQGVATGALSRQS